MEKGICPSSHAFASNSCLNWLVRDTILDLRDPESKHGGTKSYRVIKLFGWGIGGACEGWKKCSNRSALVMRSLGSLELQND